MNRFKSFSVNRWLTGFLCLSLLASLLTSSTTLLLRAAAQDNGTLQRGGKLGANLPDLASVRYRTAKQPSAPNFTSTSNPCFDCKTTSISDDAFSQARMDPLNRTGQSGVDLLSRNIHWSQSVINLKGRAGLDLNLSLVYDSLVWTKAGSQIAFDADRGQPSPGFRLGFPTIQRRYRDGQSGEYAYLLITPEGGRVELRQFDKTNVYEATDNSLLQMIDYGANGALLRRADGTQLSFSWTGGQLQCTEVKDRNGNYLTVDYDKRGHLNSITDTVGRTFIFTRDAGGNLLSIRQKSSGPDKRVLATFGYSDLVVQTNFPGLKVVGPSSGSTITVLTQVGLPDGTRYQFDYTSWGQVQRITLIAADGHTLAYTLYNLPVDTTLELADCPRVTEMRSWAENANNDREALTRFDSDPNYEWGRATLPDGSTRKEFFGMTGWQRGLSLRVEESATNGELQRVKSTEWSQQPVDNSDFYRTVPHSQDVVRIEVNGSQQRTRTEFNGYGLTQDQYDYQADGVALSQHTHVEYSLDQIYLAKHIIGLIRERTTEDASGNLISKTIHTYDLPGSIVDQGAAVQHDNAAYGANVLSGRGLLNAISHWDFRHPDKAGETRIGYNTAGSIAFTRNSSGQQTNVTYDDNFSDQKGRSTLAFSTSAVHPDGSRTLTKYDYDTGTIVRTKNKKGHMKRLP
jgi:YD repeat-containing protein